MASDCHCHCHQHGLKINKNANRFSLKRQTMCLQDSHVHIQTQNVHHRRSAHIHTLALVFGRRATRTKCNAIRCIYCAMREWREENRAEKQQKNEKIFVFPVPHDYMSNFGFYPLDGCVPCAGARGCGCVQCFFLWPSATSLLAYLHAWCVGPACSR